MKDIINENNKYKKEILKLKRENEELKFLAFHDALTGVYNRTWFNREIKKDTKVYLTMVDLNRLKLINDKLGHKRGDKYIVDTAKILTDFGCVVRFGGDEFLVLTNNEKKFNKLNKYKTTRFSYGGVKPDEYNTISEALDIADARLYINKTLLEEKTNCSTINNNDEK